MKPGVQVSFYYTPQGTMSYSVDGVQQEYKIRGIDTAGPLWAVFDVYGSVRRIKLVGKFRGSMSIPGL
jgi:hypothetical protein